MTEEQAREMGRLNEAVNAFALEMKERLKEKLMQGYSGWDDPVGGISSKQLRTAIANDADEMDFTGYNDKVIDIANRCMMLWCRGIKEKAEKAEKARQLINYWQERALTAEGKAEKWDKLFEGLKVEGKNGR